MTIKKKFKPNKYQKAIFDFLVREKGNLVVEAIAGAGKTSVLLESLNIIPSDQKVLFLAFTNSVADTLKERTTGFKNVNVMTTYGLGRCIISENLGKKPIDEYKYINEFRSNTLKYTNNSRYSLKNKWKTYNKNITELIKHARLNLANTIGEIKLVAKNFEIITVADEVTVVKRLIEWGKSHIAECDFVDMIWYPLILDLKSDYFSKFNYVFVDEAQDLSKAQRELILTCSNPDTRFVFVGDSKQAIYGFNSADPKSFDELKKIPNTTVLPLSICYRCPKSVVSFVKHIVPQIEACDSAIEGNIYFNKSLSDINDGDTVLCRNNAPLMQIYSSFLRMGKKAYIAGKELEISLKDLISSNFHNAINMNLNEVGLMSELYLHYFKKRKELMEITGWEANLCDDLSELTSLLDKIETIKILSEGINNTSGLLQRIDRVFSNKDVDGICLSTVHKAKGAEYNNVFIAKKELFDPSKKKLDWEKIQEENLEYVAYTRAKRTLSFLKKEETQNSYSLPLEEIEKRVMTLYNPVKPNISGRILTKHDTISGITTPGLNMILNDDFSHLHVTEKPLNQLFGKKNKKQRKI